MVKMAVLSRISAQLRLMALLAAAADADGHDDLSWVCSTGTCGKANCTGFRWKPPFPFIYECDCHPGWSKAIDIPYAPCTIPICSYYSSCFNVPLAPPNDLPLQICDINCGVGGACKQLGDGTLPDYAYTCECQPGYANLLNDTAFPCVNYCRINIDR